MLVETLGFSLKWLILICLPLLFVFYGFLKWTYGYWRRRGVPSMEPHLLWGNIKDVVTMRKTEVGPIDRLYKFLKDKKFGGMYYLWKPVLIVKDPELVKKVLVTDFNVFRNHPSMTDMSSTDKIVHSLFTMKDDIWKERRTDFTSVFSSKKIKQYFPGLVANCHAILPSLDKSAEKREDVEFERVGQRVAINAITSTFYGLQTDVIESTNSHLIRCGEVIGHPDIWTVLKSFLYMLSPRTYSFLKLQTFPSFVYKDFGMLVRSLVKQVEESGDAPGKRDNLLGLLVEMKNCQVENGKTRMTLEEIIPHIYTFFEAGYDTSAVTLALCIFELSLKKEVQDRLREEVDDVFNKNNGQLTYEAVTSMKYLSCVLSETLRLYPPAGVLKREASVDYDLGDGVKIEKGTHVYIPVHSLHRDPEYFQNPDSFIPERFDCVQPPSVYMPFGKGPRTCIGMKFAELELKVVICLLIRHFFFKPSYKTPQPVPYDPNTVILTCRPKGGAWVKLRHRDIITQRYY